MGPLSSFCATIILDARNFFDPSKAELRRNQFGYAVGGPFWKNRIFWFTDYQGTRQVSGASTGLVSVPTDGAARRRFRTRARFVDANGNPAWCKALIGRRSLAAPGLSGSKRRSHTMSVFPNGVIPQSAWAAPVDRHFAVHSRSQRRRRTLRGLEPKGNNQRRQDRPARGLQQSEDRQLVVLLSQRLVERVRPVGGRERSWFPGHHAHQRASGHSE